LKTEAADTLSGKIRKNVFKTIENGKQLNEVVEEKRETWSEHTGCKENNRVTKSVKEQIFCGKRGWGRPRDELNYQMKKKELT
jgi:hypothetical protein